jgi:hypothetical protein
MRAVWRVHMPWPTSPAAINPLHLLWRGIIRHCAMRDILPCLLQPLIPQVTAWSVESHAVQLPDSQRSENKRNLSYLILMLCLHKTALLLLFYIDLWVICTKYIKWTPITVAARSNALTVIARSNAGIVGSNPTKAWMSCVRLFCVCVVLCVGSDLAMGWQLVQGVLPSVKEITKLKKRPGPKKGL